MTHPRIPIFLNTRNAREWRIRWYFFIGGIVFAAAWVAI